jgi:hypothetical protein
VRDYIDGRRNVKLKSVDKLQRRMLRGSIISGMALPGGVAQLGERLNGIQEASGSIPLISTKIKREEPRNGSSLLILRTVLNMFAQKPEKL